MEPLIETIVNGRKITVVLEAGQYVVTYDKAQTHTYSLHEAYGEYTSSVHHALSCEGFFDLV